MNPLVDLDHRIVVRLNAYAAEHPAYVSALEVVTTVGGPAVMRTAAGVAALVAVMKRRIRLAVWLLATVWGSGLVSTGIKELVDRQRPDVAHPVAVETSPSFPSGHAIGIVVGVTVLLMTLPDTSRPVRVTLVTTGVTAVLLVGFSRVGLGVHYPSDVLAGFTVGAAWVGVTTATLLPFDRGK